MDFALARAHVRDEAPELVSQGIPGVRRAPRRSAVLSTMEVEFAIGFFSDMCIDAATMHRILPPNAAQPQDEMVQSGTILLQ